MSTILGSKIVQERYCERVLGDDITPKISPEYQVRGIVREANFILVNVKIALKCLDRDV